MQIGARFEDVTIQMQWSCFILYLSVKNKVVDFIAWRRHFVL